MNIRREILHSRRHALPSRLRRIAAGCAAVLIFWSTVCAAGVNLSGTGTQSPPTAPQLVPVPDPGSIWTTLESGLDLAAFPAAYPHGRRFEIVVVRIVPERFDFVVRSAAEAGERALPLRAWAERHGFVAAINAGMYLPDGVTNTGYLRVGDCLNNPRIAGAFGAFFLAGPDSPDLPGVQLLDRTEDAWEELLPRYAMAVQNYRFIDAGRRLLWRPGGPEHSVAAVGRDGKGRILFIHSREPLAGVELGRLLLGLPADIRLVMYVEGGSQAGLVVRTPKLTRLWTGVFGADLWTSVMSNTPLPNVIGVKRKHGVGR